MSPLRGMRPYRPDYLPCAACGQPIRGEARMVGREVYHLLCVPHGEPSPELAERIARRRAMAAKRAARHEAPRRG